MKKLFKYIGYAILSGLALISLYLANLFFMKPYSLDHYLTKELVVGLLDSPEFMTYIGVFDPYNAILKHNQKLTGLKTWPKIRGWAKSRIFVTQFIFRVSNILFTHFLGSPRSLRPP